MIKVKTCELQGAALDWAVAKCEYVGTLPFAILKTGLYEMHEGYTYAPSTNWAQGGPLIEREKISLCWEGSVWVATLLDLNSDDKWFGHQYGPIPLIAAMRCYVASKLGDEVEIPEELA